MIERLVVVDMVLKNQNPHNLKAIYEKKKTRKRTILPDTKYNDLSVAKFINYIMDSGKKGVAEKIFYGAMDIIQNKTKTDGIKIFKKGIENTSPSVEVKSRRIGGATYQVPIEVPKKSILSCFFMDN